MVNAFSKFAVFDNLCIFCSDLPDQDQKVVVHLTKTTPNSGNLHKRSSELDRKEFQSSHTWIGDPYLIAGIPSINELTIIYKT